MFVPSIHLSVCYIDALMKSLEGIRCIFLMIISIFPHRFQSVYDDATTTWSRLLAFQFHWKWDVITKPKLILRLLHICCTVECLSTSFAISHTFLLLAFVIQLLIFIIIDKRQNEPFYLLIPNFSQTE